MTSLDAFFQGVLAVGFAVASVRLVWTARNGRRNIRLFRLVGAGLAGGWSLFYVLAAWTSVGIHVLADMARVLNYFTLMMFILWGFLFHHEAWEIGARERLEAMENGD